jgi:hypothetical protein
VGAKQSTRFALAAAAALAVVGLGSGVPAAVSERIRMPTPAEAAGPRAPLIVPRAGEVDVSVAPGQVADSEVARVSLGPDGAVTGVAVTQTLTMSGVGDFNVVLPGPALHVVGPPDQATQPGLRRGTILYQGFVPGSKTLVATATLDPAFERFRVPVIVSVRYLQDGREVKPPVTGPVEIMIGIANNSSRLVPVRLGSARAGDVASLLDALRAELKAGRVPVAGTRGVPASLSSSTAVEVVRPPVTVPFAVSGAIGFSSGSIARLRVAAPGIPTSGAGAAFRAVVPSARFPNGKVLIRMVGEAFRLGTPLLEMSVASMLPEPSQLDPPGGGTWSRALARADAAEVRDALALGQTTMWQALRRAEFDAYLGNPGTGPSRTRYEYVMGPVARRAAPQERAGVRPGAVVLALVAAALAIANALVLRSRS